MSRILPALAAPRTMHGKSRNELSGLMWMQHPSCPAGEQPQACPTPEAGAEASRADAGGSVAVMLFECYFFLLSKV